jgi:hypothetical protein
MEQVSLTASSRQQAIKPLRVCIIGNSLVGAVLRAYQDRFPVDGYAFSFFAHPGHEYETVGFDGTMIVNVPFSNGGSFDMADYDEFVVYGDLPTPSQAVQYWRSLSADLYSVQVRQSVFRDWVFLSKSARIMQELCRLAKRPVFGISKNNLLYDLVEAKSSCDEGELLIKNSISPNIYIPHPTFFIGVDNKLNPKYYCGSLNVLGVEPDRTVQPQHHHFHFNQLGGAIMLDRILEWLRVCLTTCSVGDSPK